MKDQCLPHWRWLWGRFRPLLRWQVGSVLLVTASSAASLVDPLILKWLIDSILPNRNVLLLAIAAVAVFASFQARTILGTLGTYCVFHANQRFILALRRELLAHMSRLGADYHDRTPVGAKSYIIQDLTAELGQLSADVFPLVLRTAVLGILAASAMIALDRPLSLAVLPLTLVFFAVVRKLRSQLRLNSEQVQGEASKASSVLQEQLASAVQIQLLRRERFQANRVFQAWAGLMRSEYRRKRSEIKYALLTNTVIVTGIAVVLAYGGLEVVKGRLTIGGLVAFYSYLARLFEPLYLAVEMNSRFQRITAAVGRIRNFLDAEPSIRNHAHAAPLPALPAPVPRGHIVMRQVAFGYDGRPNLIENCQLEIEPQERIAIAGESGGGKSTFAKLISRVYDVRAGSVLIDGVDVRRIALGSLRREVVYVPQRAAVFSGTIEENLRLGRSGLLARDVEKAADLVGLFLLLENSRDGWRQEIGPAGARLSGGERQRLALARAVLERPRVLVLDESTSELDLPSERAILEKLDSFLPETTLVLISHRLTALTWVDRILVVRQGALIESGRHSDLYARASVYRGLYERESTSAN